MSTPGPDFRPCGACNALVSAAEGCKHWKPNSPTGKRIGWVKGRSRGLLPEDSPDIAQRTIDVRWRQGD